MNSGNARGSVKLIESPRSEGAFGAEELVGAAQYLSEELGYDFDDEDPRHLADAVRCAMKDAALSFVRMARGGLSIAAHQVSGEWAIIPSEVARAMNGHDPLLNEEEVYAVDGGQYHALAPGFALAL
jgi:hypothetical protein